MKSKNEEAIKQLFVPEGQLIAIDKPKSGKGASTTRSFTAASFAKIVVGVGEELIEQMPTKEVNISGDLAIVSGRYTFYIAGKLSHCGMNVFNLAHTKNGWKIANAASTIESQCRKDMHVVKIPEIEADSKDVSTIDSIVKALYATISGGAGKEREWGRDKTLYTPDIRFISISSGKNKSSINQMTHRQYLDGSNDFFVKAGFTEREINRVTRRFGNIAQVFSTYEWETADKKSKGRGINSIGLFFDGKRWWISALTWENEHEGNPIPKKFLPKSDK